MEGPKMKENKPSAFLRQTSSFASFVIICLLALGIVILLEIISNNHNLFVDLTPGKIHTFSEQTQKILRALDKDVEFISFYRMGDREELEYFYKRLSNYSKRLKYRLIDLDRNPGKAKLYGITNAQTVIKCNGNTRTIGYATEERVINAILKLTQGVTKTVYFTKGHNEKEGYADLKAGLQNENWRVGKIDLLENKDLSINETVLVIAGPEKDFLDAEISVLEQYLHNGGKVVLLVEPFAALPNLKAFLEKYRVALGDGIIVDRQGTLSGGDYLTPLVSEKFQCPVTKGLSPSSRFLFPTVRSVEVMSGGADGIVILPLARTSPNSWTKSDMEAVKNGDVDFEEGIDMPGPLVVAVWVRVINEGKGAEGELICIGDSDFISNSHYDVFANKDFFLNCLEWLAEDKDLISIRPKKVDFPFHFLSASQGRMLFMVSIVGLPAIFLVISIILFSFRRVHG
jgi:ABC-2 type transport system permease protein